MNFTHECSNHFIAGIGYSTRLSSLACWILYAASHSHVRLASKLDDCLGTAIVVKFMSVGSSVFLRCFLRWITVSTVANTMEGTELFLCFVQACISILKTYVEVKKLTTILE